MKTITKSFNLINVKALKEGEFEAYASVEVVDRDNEIVDIDSLDIDEFLLNPILLYQHDAWDNSTLPIGKIIEIKKTKLGDKKALLIRGFISKIHDNFRIQVIEEKILNSLSISFILGDRFSENLPHTVLKNCTLLEISIVKIPANMLALIKTIKNKLPDNIITINDKIKINVITNETGLKEIKEIFGSKEEAEKDYYNELNRYINVKYDDFKKLIKKAAALDEINEKLIEEMALRDFIKEAKRQIKGENL